MKSATKCASSSCLKNAPSTPDSAATASLRRTTAGLFTLIFTLLTVQSCQPSRSKKTVVLDCALDREFAEELLSEFIDDDLKETAEKVPVLGDLPLLGRLFRFDSVTKVKRNLMVFLRPTILHEENQDLVSSAKYNYIRARQLAERDKGILLMPDEEAPLMMELLDELQTPPPALPPTNSHQDDADTRKISSFSARSK